MTDLQRVSPITPGSGAPEGPQAKKEKLGEKDLVDNCISAIKGGEIVSTKRQCWKTTGWFDSFGWSKLTTEKLVEKAGNGKFTEKNIRFLSKEQIGQLKGKLKPEFNFELAILNARDRDKQEALAGLFVAKFLEDWSDLRDPVDCKAFSQALLHIDRDKRIEILKSLPLMDKESFRSECTYVLPKFDMEIIFDFLVAHAEKRGEKVNDEEIMTAMREHIDFTTRSEHADKRRRGEPENPSPEQFVAKSSEVVGKFEKERKRMESRNLMPPPPEPDKWAKRDVAQGFKEFLNRLYPPPDMEKEGGAYRRGWLQDVSILQGKDRYEAWEPEELALLPELHEKLRPEYFRLQNINGPLLNLLKEGDTEKIAQNVRGHLKTDLDYKIFSAYLLKMEPHDRDAFLTRINIDLRDADPDHLNEAIKNSFFKDALLRAETSEEREAFSAALSKMQPRERIAFIKSLPLTVTETGNVRMPVAIQEPLRQIFRVSPETLCDFWMAIAEISKADDSGKKEERACRTIFEELEFTGEAESVADAVIQEFQKLGKGDLLKRIVSEESFLQRMGIGMYGQAEEAGKVIYQGKEGREKDTINFIFRMKEKLGAWSDKEKAIVKPQIVKYREILGTAPTEAQ